MTIDDYLLIALGACGVVLIITTLVFIIWMDDGENKPK